MSESPFSLPTLTAVTVRAALVTVSNQLFSLWALTADDVAADGWIAQAAARLSPEQRDFNRLLFAAFGAALLPADTPADFPAYLAGLAALPGADFQARLANAAQAVRAPVLRAEAEALLADPAALQLRIVEHLRSLWGDVAGAGVATPHTHVVQDDECARRVDLQPAAVADG
jgi:hypothetical protein